MVDEGLKGWVCCWWCGWLGVDEGVVVVAEHAAVVLVDIAGLGEGGEGCWDVGEVAGYAS